MNEIKVSNLAILLLLTVTACSYKSSDSSPANPNQRAAVGVDAKFTEVFQKIIQPKCLTCHNGAESPKYVDLSSYSAIIDNVYYPPLVNAGNPEESWLYTSCNTGYMPRGLQRLKSSELTMLHDWILAGALNN